MKIKEEIYSDKKPKFKINDRVRILKYKNTKVIGQKKSLKSIK